MTMLLQRVRVQLVRSRTTTISSSSSYCSSAAVSSMTTRRGITTISRSSMLSNTDFNNEQQSKQYNYFSQNQLRRRSCYFEIHRQSFSSTMSNKKSSSAEQQQRKLLYQPLDPLEQPETFVSGVSKQMLEENPDIANFFVANFGTPMTDDDVKEEEAAARKKKARGDNETDDDIDVWKFRGKEPPNPHKSRVLPLLTKRKGTGRIDPDIRDVWISPEDMAKIENGELNIADLFNDDLPFEAEDDDDNDSNGTSTIGGDSSKKSALDIARSTAPYVAEKVYPIYYNDVEGAIDPISSANGVEKDSKKQYKHNIRPMKAYVRHVEGSRACRRLRRMEPIAMVPGMVSGAAKSYLKENGGPIDFHRLMIMTPHNEIQRERNKFWSHMESHVYKLTVWESPEAEQEYFANKGHASDDSVDDTDEDVDEDDDITINTPGVVQQLNVLPLDYQKHPVLEKHWCLNYLVYVPNRTVVPLPISYINEEESPTLKRGGFIVPHTRYVPCLIEDGYDIPDDLKLDCRGLKYKDVVRLERIIFPEGVRYCTKRIKDPKKFLHGSVFGKFGGGDGPGGDTDGEEGDAGET